MECPSCTFQNIPGTQTCVRCHTRLDLDAIEFLPPRAARGRARRRVRAIATAAQFRVASGWADVGRALRLPPTVGLTLSHAAMAVVPGLPQIRARAAGMRFVGWCVLGLWCVMVLVAALLVGTGLSTLLCFASVSVHCFSISLMLTPALQHMPLLGRLVIGISLYFTVLFAVYWPGWAMCHRVAQVLPLNGLGTGGALADGDVLLYSGPWTRPSRWHRGDLVVAAIDPARFPGVVIVGGVNVDRIVGLPGDEVQLRGGTVMINGEESAPERQPLTRPRNLRDSEFVLAEDDYLVLPSSLRWTGHGDVQTLAATQMERLSHYSQEQILGKVMFRIRPWNRFGFPKGAP